MNKARKARQEMEYAASVLQGFGFPFVSHSSDAHLEIRTSAGFIDFWPLSGLWKYRNNKIIGDGIFTLIREIETVRLNHNIPSPTPITDIDLINERMTELLAPWGKCYPWTPANVLEAMEELNDETLQRFCTHAIAGRETDAHAALSAAIQAYWHAEAAAAARQLAFVQTRYDEDTMKQINTMIEQLVPLVNTSNLPDWENRFLIDVLKETEGGHLIGKLNFNQVQGIKKIFGRTIEKGA